MNLDELKLNRFGYKATITPFGSNPVLMSSENDSLKKVIAKDNDQAAKKEAKNIITGTVITTCLIKSSDQDDRIEIGQNLEGVLTSNIIGDLNFSGAKGLDYLVAYRPGGRIGFLLTGVGMAYIGYGMPATKVISLIAGGTLVQQTTSEVLWSMTSPGTAQYLITHNLNSLQYGISVIPTDVGTSTTGLFASITSKGLDSFVVEIYNSANTHTPSDFDCIVSVYN